MISVCMATFNGEEFILQQINSILSQLNNTDELIISDNESTDNTINLIKSIKDPRIKLFTYNCATKNKFKRIVLNFNNSIAHSSGDYIFLSDQDDVWLNDKVDSLLKDLQKFGCVISNYSIIDSADNIIVNKKFNTNPLKNRIYSIIFFPFLGCSMAFTRKFFYEYCYPFPKKIILHDIWIGLIAYITRQLTFNSKILLAYRSHSNNMTTASCGKSINSLKYKIEYRFYLYIKLISRLCFKLFKIIRTNK